MQMDMRTHLLVPGMEHGQEAQLRAESVWVGGDSQQGLRYRSKENVVEGSWVFDSE